MKVLAVTSLMALFLVAACGNSVNIPDYQAVVGTYQEVQVSATTGIDMKLHLNDDFTAEMETDFVNDQPAVVESGSWVIQDNGNVTVRLSETDGVTMYPEVEIEFSLSGYTLESVEWDQSIYGDQAMKFVRI